MFTLNYQFNKKVMGSCDWIRIGILQKSRIHIKCGVNKCLHGHFRQDQTSADFYTVSFLCITD